MVSAGANFTLQSEIKERGTLPGQRKHAPSKSLYKAHAKKRKKRKQTERQMEKKKCSEEFLKDLKSVLPLTTHEQASSFS